MVAPIWVVADPLDRKQTASTKPSSVVGGVSATLSDKGEASDNFQNPFRDETIVGSLPAETLPRPTVSQLGLVQFDDIPLADAMKVFSAETGLNVLCSTDAGETPITVYLRDVAPLEALSAIVKANGLFYRVEENSKIVRIATAAEYEKDLTSFRDEKTRVFTLLYPNPVAVAQVIAQVFGDRVDLQMADADVHDLSDLSQRFNRFDLMDGRSLGLGASQATQQRNPQNNANQPGFGLGGQAGQGLGLLNGGGNGLARNQPRQDSSALPDLSADEIQALEDSISRDGDIGSRARSSLLQRGKATIFVSTIRRNNQIVVRTGDERSMEEIEKLVAQLDVPTPTVMLEVKVLRVALAEGIESAFEYFAGGDDEAVGFSDGSLLPAFPGGSPVTRSLGQGLGVSGRIPGALTFQVVDENFQFRMQLLESQARVTALATPLILTANNEVSRIFVGDTLPFTVGFTPSQVVGGFNSVTGAVAATPVTELRDVGQSLLITPNINADRTVTLRIVEENSERVLGGASIPVPDVDGAGVTSVNVDTVRRRTLSGTVVAQDGMAVALGGLIEESLVESKDQVPVLGDVPGLGFLFKRQINRKQRSELIVVIRPYVFNTPSESAATSEMMLSDLSLHPNAADASGTLNTYMPCEVVRTDAECVERAKLLQLHNVRK
jgi:general secretion pathway protein D